jgi:hypothetical protein
MIKNISLKKIQLFSLALSLISFNQAYANTYSDEIEGIKIDLRPTMHHIGIQVNYSGDTNNNARASVEANINNQGFKPIHRLSRVSNNRFVGSVFSLKPKTNVKVRVTLSDPDGVKNATLSSTSKTRSETVPVSKGKVIHISVKKGDDKTGDGSAKNPYKSIQYATEFLKAGTTLLIHAGVYHEAVDIPVKYGGTKNNPITIRSAGDGEVVLEGFSKKLKRPSAWKKEGQSIYSTTLDNTYFIGIDGKRLWRYNSLNDLKKLRFKNKAGFYIDEEKKQAYIKLPKNSTPKQHEIQVSVLEDALTVNDIANLVIRGLTFRGYGKTQFSEAISIAENSREIWIVNNRFENLGTGIWLEGYSENIIVMNNDFSDKGVTDFDWEALKEHQTWLERGAVFCSNDGYSGHSLMFYKNKVHDIFDGIKVTSLDPLANMVNTDIEGNLFSHLSDDGIETDGWSSNVRVVNNRFEHLLVGVSVAPAQGGPTYIIGNVMSDLKNSGGTDYETTAVKFNVSDEEPSGEIFIYHNTATTFEPKQAAFSVTNHTLSKGVFLKNNIWAGTQYSMYYWLDSVLNFNQDYDLHFSNASSTLIFHQDNEYKTLQEYTHKTNLCKNCLAGNPLFKDYQGGDYRLTGASPAKDRGILIHGINDHYRGDAPDIGASEYMD